MGIYKTLLIAKWHYFWLLLRFFINALIDSWFILGKLVVAWEVFEATVHLLSSQIIEMRKDLYRIPFDVADVTWKSCHLIDVQSCFCFLIYFELPKPVIWGHCLHILHSEKQVQMDLYKYYRFQTEDLQEDEARTIYLSFICAGGPHDLLLVCFSLASVWCDKYIRYWTKCKI